jgi:hypothetical protein
MLKVEKLTISPNGHDRFSRRPTPKPRIYCHPVGETILDNLRNRHSRPYNLYKPLVKAFLEEQGVDTTKVRVRWSQYAGCSCPCSPGFILETKHLPWNHELHGKDIWLDVKES